MSRFLNRGALPLLLVALFLWLLGLSGRWVELETLSGMLLAAVSLLVMLGLAAVLHIRDRSAAGDLGRLAERARELAQGDLETPLADGDLRAEHAELARAIEGVRKALLHHRDAAEEHRAVMEEIFSSLREGLMAVSSDRRVVVANRRVAKLFGSGSELTGRSILEVVRHRTVEEALERAIAGEAATDRFSFDSGERERQIEIRTFPVESSAEIAAVALFIDVTAIERLQRIRRDFLDDFSHEVRTPLAGLRSAWETLDHGGLTRESELQLRQVMKRQIARIERLVSDLSELNQIESGQLVLHRHPSDLRQMLEDLCEEFQARHPAVRFVVDGPATVLSIDPARVQQILVNLLDNACRHGGGGEIQIEVARRSDGAVVGVSDQGPGIPPDEIDRIFNRFYRVDRSRSGPGTGLGLAIAKHLAIAHGGVIRAFNRPGGGATFEVSLPDAP
jgi:two-component system, OmpR family, phosphate regulon sensor histidine kinase PhoR